jgi:hypothetical protein
LFDKNQQNAIAQTTPSHDGTAKDGIKRRHRHNEGISAKDGTSAKDGISAKDGTSAKTMPPHDQTAKTTPPNDRTTKTTPPNDQTIKLQRQLLRMIKPQRQHLKMIKPHRQLRRKKSHFCASHGTSYPTATLYIILGVLGDSGQAHAVASMDSILLCQWFTVGILICI